MFRLKIIIPLIIILSGFLTPDDRIIPVKGGGINDINRNSFWSYPWGKSVTHKGIDIFAKEGTDLFSSTYGIVLFRGEFGRGGNVVAILGPKWRLHYYAHLKEISTGFFNPVYPGEIIGTVGKTGNAANTPPHLHYSIMTLIPYLWRADSSIQGWKKIFFLNPYEEIK